MNVDIIIAIRLWIFLLLSSKIYSNLRVKNTVNDSFECIYIYIIIYIIWLHLGLWTLHWSFYCYVTQLKAVFIYHITTSVGQKSKQGMTRLSPRGLTRLKSRCSSGSILYWSCFQAYSGFWSIQLFAVLALQIPFLFWLSELRLFSAPKGYLHSWPCGPIYPSIFKASKGKSLPHQSPPTRQISLANTFEGLT